jgi:hypothetical protein
VLYSARMKQMDLNKPSHRIPKERDLKRLPKTLTGSLIIEVLMNLSEPSGSLRNGRAKWFSWMKKMYGY